MYLIQGHYSHIVLCAALAMWLVVIRPSPQGWKGVGVARALAWLAWIAAALLAANDVGYHLHRAALNVAKLNLEATLTGMSVWPVGLALAVDRWRARPGASGEANPAGTAALVTLVCLPAILLLLFLLSAGLG